MVNYVPSLMKVMHKFTPEGQTLLLDILKKNRGVIDKRYGFAKELPSILVKDETIDQLAKTCTAQGGIGIVFDELLVDGLKINCVSKSWQKTSRVYTTGLKEIFASPGSMIEELKIEFESKRAELCKFLRECGFNKEAKMVKNSSTPEELARVVVQTADKNTAGQSIIIQNLMMKDKMMDITSLAKLNEHEWEELLRRIDQFTKETNKHQTNWYSLRALQEVHKENGKIGDFYLGLQKIISPKSTNPEIVKIEEILKKEFGMDFVHFNNLEDAKNFLEVTRIARLEGIPTVKNVSTSNLLPKVDGFNTFDSNSDNLIFLKSKRDREISFQKLIELKANLKNKKFKKYLYMVDETYKNLGYPQQNIFSTKSELHIPMHETVHSEAIGRRFNPQLCTKLSDRQKQIASDLSTYSEMNVNGITEEVRTEARTRQILSKYFPDKAEKLTPEQEELLKFLSFD